MRSILRAILPVFLVALALLIAPAGGQVPPPVPALPDQQRITSYQITSSNCACAIGFALYGDQTDYQNWVQIWLNGVNVAYNDPSFGWSVTSPSGPLGLIALPISDAVLTFSRPQTGTVMIVGARRPRRLSQYTEGRGVAARDLNVSITDLVAQNREQWDILNRALLAPPGGTVGFPAGQPLIGAGTSIPTSGTKSGSTTNFATVTGSLTNGHCLSVSGSGDIIDAGGPCTTGGGGGTVSAGTAGNPAMYLANGNTVVAQGAGNPMTMPGDVYFKSGRPWVDVRAFGAVVSAELGHVPPCGSGASYCDSSTAIQNAINALEANYSSGMVYFPTSGGDVYCVSNGIVTHNLGVVLQGEAREITVLAACAGDVPVIDGRSAVVVDRMSVWGTNSPGNLRSKFGGPTTFGATYPAIRLQAGGTLSHVTVNGGFEAVDLEPGGDDSLFFDIYTFGAYGPANVITRAGGWWIRDKFDQNGPGCTAGTPCPPNGFGCPTGGTACILNWAPTSGYNGGGSPWQVGQLTQDSTGAYLLMAVDVTGGGISGATHPVVANYGVNITDGGVIWQFFAPTNFAGVHVDATGSENQIFQSDFTGQVYTYGIEHSCLLCSSTFTGSVTAGVLTVTAKTAGNVAPAQFITCTGCAANLQVINPPGTGIGGTGTYNVTCTGTGPSGPPNCTTASAAMTGTANAPRYTTVTDSVGGQMLQAVIHLTAGTDFAWKGGHFGGCYQATCAAVQATSGWGGNLKIQDVDIINMPGASAGGISIQAGNVAILTGNRITLNGGTGIQTANGLTGIVIGNNEIDGSGNGINIGSSSDNVKVIGNDCSGLTNCVINNSLATATHMTVLGNN